MTTWVDLTESEIAVTVVPATTLTIVPVPLSAGAAELLRLAQYLSLDGGPAHDCHPITLDGMLIPVDGGAP